MNSKLYNALAAGYTRHASFGGLTVRMTQPDNAERRWYADNPLGHWLLAALNRRFPIARRLPEGVESARCYRIRILDGVLDPALVPLTPVGSWMGLVLRRAHAHQRRVVTEIRLVEAGIDGDSLVAVCRHLQARGVAYQFDWVSIEEVLPGWMASPSDPEPKPTLSVET